MEVDVDEVLFSFVIKTEVVQNVNIMLERQKNMPKDRQTDGQKDRTTFQLSCQNKSQTDRKIYSSPGRQTE